ncbi:hypothetical protein H5410_040322 [Solanum commersonii]|uniref:Uncharacterized protein n=1 Tax=Solanum commersonii TaxID=4109 RepID=A0A9J5XRQ3_SOLCO|nr:hypothetical protein H5410_040322 [Solanum commersonii]
MRVNLINRKVQRIVLKRKNIKIGSARILSSGRVVGNPGSWNIVKDNRFTTLTEENLADKEAFNNASFSETKGPNPCIKNSIQQRGHQGSL